MTTQSAHNMPPGAPGDEFGGLYDAEFDFVLGSLRRLGVQPRDLEDLAHDVFLAAYRHLDRFDRSRPLRPWLFGIAYRVVAKFYRRPQTHREVIAEPPPEVESAGPIADELMLEQQRRELVLRALEGIPVDRRAVFVMAELEGYTMPEIAAALGIPVNTAYSRLRIGRKEFIASLRRAQARQGEP